MTKRRFRNPGGRTARQNGSLAVAMSRALHDAEVARDRARAGLKRLEEQIAEREELGLSTEFALAHLARLRIMVDEAEADLLAARSTLRRAA